jgi:hypothetical protein
MLFNNFLVEIKIYFFLIKKHHHTYNSQNIPVYVPNSNREIVFSLPTDYPVINSYSHRL